MDALRNTFVYNKPVVKESISYVFIPHIMITAEDLAVDWIANNLYWTDTLNRRLEVLDLDSIHKTELLQTGPHSGPRAIAVDPRTRYLTFSCITFLIDILILTKVHVLD